MHAQASQIARAPPSALPTPARGAHAPPAAQQQPEQPQQQIGVGLSRRQALILSAAAALAAVGTSPPPALASGLLQLPLTAGELHNTYFLVRAGQSVAEAQGYILTNPVAKTSMTAGLSADGKRQVVRSTYQQLLSLGIDNPGWIWPSITQNSYQTAEILGALFGVGRSRIVPEFSFLDARGVGEYERLPLSEAAAALEAGDALAATWRPPPNVDGTVHESSADVLVRGRQLLSLLETQYIGEEIIIVSPDSDNLSILQAGVLGVDLRSHHTYGFQPGEARVLQLSDAERPAAPQSFACPRPPQCV